MTSITAPPGTLPHRVLSVDEVERAARRVIKQYRKDAEKLERMAHWDDARHLQRDIQQLTSFLATDFFALLTKEIIMASGE